MEILIRPIPHYSFEHEIGHCSFWPSAGTEAISCTYNMGGFTPMTSIMRELNLDSEEFRECAHMHVGAEFRVLVHAGQKPTVITTTKTPRWESEPNATKKIISAAESERCGSLCMTHFGFVQGTFPKEAFAQCVRQALQANSQSKLTSIVLDVDERYLDAAKAVYQKVVHQ